MKKFEKKKIHSNVSKWNILIYLNNIKQRWNDLDERCQSARQQGLASRYPGAPESRGWSACLCGAAVRSKVGKTAPYTEMQSKEKWKQSCMYNHPLVDRKQDGYGISSLRLALDVFAWICTLTYNIASTTLKASVERVSMDMHQWP